MAYTAHPTVVTGQAWTAANQNTYVRDNQAATFVGQATEDGELAYATAANAVAAALPETALGLVEDEVTANETTASASYTDLGTSGPAVTVNIKSSGKAMVFFGAEFYNNTALRWAGMGIDVDGGGVTQPMEALYYAAVANDTKQTSKQCIVTGLTAGDRVLTAKYKQVSGGNAGFRDRYIIALPI